MHGKVKVRAAALALAAAALLSQGCVTQQGIARQIPPERRAQPEVVTLETTGYCPCGRCCGWHRNCLLVPVYSSGRLAGRRKEVGRTASGTQARPGTLAADPKVYPFGTVMYIPGYGYGRVEDTGGDIRGARIDLFFRHHSEAERWGRVRKQVQVWRP